MSRRYFFFTEVFVTTLNSIYFIRKIVPSKRIVTNPQISVNVVSRIDVPTGGSILNFLSVSGMKTPQIPAIKRVIKTDIPKIAPRTILE